MGVAKNGQAEKRDAAKARSEEKKTKSAQAGFAGFVNFKPTAVEKEGLKAWLEDTERVETDTQAVVSDGWKLTLARDKNEGTFVASVARWDAGHESAGIILNCRTADVVGGHLRVVYALVYVYRENLIDYVTKPDEDSLF